MRLAILSDPNNFHTQKWARALMEAGARVTVFSFEKFAGEGIHAVRIKPPLSAGGRYSYLSYLTGGKRLSAALVANKISIVNALNVTPFGVWGMQAGAKPLIASALGADILEYPPVQTSLPHPEARSWSSTESELSRLGKWKLKRSRNFYRAKVAQVLQCADLITGDNQYLVDKIKEWFEIPAGKIRMLHWGVEEELFLAEESQLNVLRKKFRILPGQKVVLSPRGAKPVYQADIILDAFEKLLRAGEKQANFILLSAGYEIASGVKMKALKLQEEFSNFQFVSEVMQRKEVYALWNLVDVFVSAPVYDGYSATVAEGRYIGAIPVVNNIPANREVITHLKNGFMLDDFNANNLTETLQTILEDIHNLKKAFAPVNRNWIVKHSLVKNNAKIFLDFCDELL